MCKSPVAIVWLAAILLGIAHLVPAQTAQRVRALQIVTPNLPVPTARQKYSVELKAIGGKPPYQWSIVAKPLPRGLTLDTNTGVIFGIPRSGDEFSVLVRVADSSDPQIANTRLLIASAGAPLTVRWTANPHVENSYISGALRVVNGGKDTVSLTVIVVAVNEIGKAFALRYEHLPLGQGNETPDLVFNTGVPMGHYTVHADAVGEVPAKNAIYRDRREVEGLVVQAQYIPMR